MGDLMELIAALAVISIGLLGSKKKKKPTNQPATRRPPHQRPAPARQPDPFVVGDKILPELRRRLEERQAPKPRKPSAPAAGAVVSLETLEPAGVESHARFHEKYIRPSSGPATVTARPTDRVPEVNIRDAVIWSEILGPPKALRD